MKANGISTYKLKKRMLKYKKRVKKLEMAIFYPTFSFIVAFCWSCGIKDLMVCRNIRSQGDQ